ncbi:hypothetical protein KY347_06705 [Candidatus Woesearchaeota archaeon]|nr:hypothetical protein [Candidatus Woesearchaeota archaeon]
MGLTDSIIETGVDKLVKLVNSKGRISSYDAAKELGVGMSVVMEWADFLEEEGIINIEYKFTKPFLVARKVTKKDVQEKAKEFSGKRDVFVRKAEVSLSFLDRESEKLKKLKEEFDKLKGEFGLDIESVKSELEELKKYDHLKIELDKQIEKQKTTSVDKLKQTTKQILTEKKKYQDLLAGIKKEKEVLREGKLEAASIEESEKIIKDRLRSLKSFIKKVEGRAKKEEVAVKVSERNIGKLNLMAENAKDLIEKEKTLIEALANESKNQAEKIKKLQDAIINKIMAKEKKLSGVKRASKKMKLLFKKKVGVMNIIEKVNKDRNDLQNELIALVKRAKAFQLSSKSADVGDRIAELEERFRKVDEKKKTFEKELKQLGSVLR